MLFTFTFHLLIFNMEHFKMNRGKPGILYEGCAHCILLTVKLSFLGQAVHQTDLLNDE